MTETARANMIRDIETRNARIVVYFDCDDIKDAEYCFNMDDEERETATRNIAECGRVCVDLNGHVRDYETVTADECDEFREINWERDFQC